jgi:polyisoprenoid-binding protein YceI
MLVQNIIKFLLLSGCLLSGAVSAGEHYAIDPQHTFSSFEYMHWGLSLQRGRFNKSSGFIDFDSEAKSGYITIEIDANSVSTGTELFDKIMRSSSFFDAQQFPNIVFDSTKFIFDNDKLSKIEGNLTVKESTKPVTIEVTYFNCRFMLLYLKKACGANGYAKILRSDYKMDNYAPFVSNEVTLYFSVEAINDE